MAMDRWTYIEADGETWVEIGTPVRTRYALTEGPRAFSNLRAVLMDMDGSSTDTEKLVLESMRRAVAGELGRADFSFAAADFPNIIGDSTTNHMRYLSRTYGFPAEHIDRVMADYYRFYHKLLEDIAAGRVQDRLIEPMPDLRRFLETAKRQGLRIALVTSSLGKEVELVMPVVFAGMGMDGADYRDYYDAVMFADHVGEPFLKPHPNLYTLAMERVGVAPHECFVVEDSTAGILAGRLAGCSVVAVPHPHTKEHDFRNANLGVAANGLADILERDFYRAV